MPIPQSRGVIVWITGLSVAGKTTVATRLCEALVARRLDADVLDGDAMHHHILQGLGLSREGREENIRRAVPEGKGPANCDSSRGSMIPTSRRLRRRSRVLRKMKQWTASWMRFCGACCRG